MAYSGTQTTRLGLSGIPRSLYGSFAGKSAATGGYAWWAFRKPIEMDRTLEDTFYLRFHTKNFSTGAPATLSGTPVVSAYEDGSVTQITAGITLGVDHDGVTGLNLLTIVATAANGYGSGQDYDLVITTGTVGGVSVVGDVVGHFSLSLSAAAVDLANGTDGLGAIKAETASILADTNELQTDDIPTTLATLATAAALATVDTIVDAILVDTGTTIPAVLGTPAGADMSTDIAAVKTDTAAILVDTGTTLDAALAVVDANVDAILLDTAEIGAAGAGLTAVPWNAAWDAEVQSECADALTAYDPPTNTEMEARTPTAAQLAYMVANAATAKPVTFSGTGTTTTGTMALVDAATPSAVDDQYNGRILVFNAGTLDEVATDITDYDGTTKVVTVTAVPVAITSSHTAIMY